MEVLRGINCVVSTEHLNRGHISVCVEKRGPYGGVLYRYFLKYISVPSAFGRLALLKTFVLFGEHLPEDEAHDNAEDVRRNANRVRVGVGGTPGPLPCIPVRIMLMPKAVNIW